jgi:hypothetical protein
MCSQNALHIKNFILLSGHKQDQLKSFGWKKYPTNMYIGSVGRIVVVNFNAQVLVNPIILICDIIKLREVP